MGTACFDEECALLFCKSATTEMLIELLKTYQEDDEVVLQILYVFLVMMSHPSSAEYVINNTGTYTHPTQFFSYIFLL